MLKNKACVATIIGDDETSTEEGGEVQLAIASIVGFVLPLVGIVCIYSRIFCEARLNSERTRRNSVASTTLEAVNPGQINHAIPHYGVHLDVMGGGGCGKMHPDRSPSSNSNLSAAIPAGVGTGRKMSSYQTVKLKINNAGAVLKEGEGRKGFLFFSTFCHTT